MKRVALVHDWLIHMRGGEKVLDCLAELYPEATLYTLFYDRKHLSPALKRMKIEASFLHYLPGIKKYYRWLLPILPLIIRMMRVKDAEIVISSSHCVSKGIRIPKDAYHICYCHTPMRYAWGYTEEYFGRFPLLFRPLIQLILKWSRFWDLRGNSRVNQFIANSENVKARIKRYYDREAGVLYPPLDTHAFEPSGEAGDYYLVVSAFVPYKRVDLVIEAFNELDRKLLIVGSGPLEKKYRSLVQSDKISFVGGITDQELKRLYGGAKATIFPTEEDFGIVPLESQACGTPVIALGKGGALESVKTGLFFDSQDSQSLQRAVLAFEEKKISKSGIADQVQTFSRNHFKERFREWVESPTPVAISL